MTTSLLILNAVLSTGIVAVIVGMLAFAVHADRHAADAPTAPVPSRSSAPQLALAAASAD